MRMSRKKDISASVKINSEMTDEESRDGCVGDEDITASIAKLLLSIHTNRLCLRFCFMFVITQCKRCIGFTCNTFPNDFTVTTVITRCE